MVAPVAAGKRVPLSAEDARLLREDPDLIRRVNLPRSVVPAITHVDYSARIQTVDARHGRLQRLMQRFFERTGCPIVVNTSFNLSWEPIVLTPAEAYATFMHSEMDALVLEDVLLLKTAQPSPVTVPQPAKPGPAVSGLSWWSRLRGGGGSAIDPELARAHGPDHSDRTVRQFALIGAALLAGLSLWNGRAAGATPSVVRTAAAGVALALVGGLWPRTVRPVYRVALAVTAPIGAVVSRLVLAAIYYLIFTPLGLLFRLVGRDELALGRPDPRDTYWRPSRGPRAARDYLRQS
jgi:hypothetical protein